MLDNLGTLVGGLKVRRTDDRVRLLARRRYDWTRRFPRVVHAGGYDWTNSLGSRVWDQASPAQKSSRILVQQAANVRKRVEFALIDRMRQIE